MGSISIGNPWQASHTTVAYNDIKEIFLAKEWNFFHVLGKKLDFLHLKDFYFFFKYKCQLYLNQPLTPPQCMIIATYCTLNHRLAIEIGQWMTIPISRDTRLCHFCFYDTIENEPHFVLECSLYNPITDMFTFLLFENLLPKSLTKCASLSNYIIIAWVALIF